MELFTKAPKSFLRRTLDTPPDLNPHTKQQHTSQIPVRRLRPEGLYEIWKGNLSHTIRADGTALECRVCYINAVNVALVPCGHCLCATCYSSQHASDLLEDDLFLSVLPRRALTTRCPTCTQAVEHMLRIYL